MNLCHVCLLPGVMSDAVMSRAHQVLLSVSFVVFDWYSFVLFSICLCVNQCLLL